MAKMDVVTIEKLGYYDGKLKTWVGDQIGDLDTSSDVSIASKSGDTITLTGSVAEEDGVIKKGSATDITLADVAATGEAGDVSYTNTSSGLSSTDVQAAIDEIAAQSAGGVGSKTIYVTDNSSGQSDYAKVYKIWQGANAPDAPVNPAELKGTINIPKDKVLEAASIVDITYSEGHLYDGVTDVTTLIKGAGSATSADAGKYLKMEMQNVTDPLYVNLQTFVDVYTAAPNATEIQIAINNHVVSASVVGVDGAKVIYKAETSAGAGDGETVKAALTRLDGNASTTGSVAKKVADAIAALDTTNDVTIASVASDIVTLKAGVKEVDGVIAQGTGSDITLAKAAKTGASADVSYSNTISSTAVTNVDDALDALVTLVGDGVEECSDGDIDALFT